MHEKMDRIAFSSVISFEAEPPASSAFLWSPVAPALPAKQSSTFRIGGCQRG
jgi:hypothetical protein